MNIWLPQIPIEVVLALTNLRSLPVVCRLQFLVQQRVSRKEAEEFSGKRTVVFQVGCLISSVINYLLKLLLFSTALLLIDW